jgi:hypothetical protein
MQKRRFVGDVQDAAGCAFYFSVMKGYERACGSEILWLLLHLNYGQFNSGWFMLENPWIANLNGYLKGGSCTLLYTSVEAVRGSTS